MSMQEIKVLILYPTILVLVMAFFLLAQTGLTNYKLGKILAIFTATTAGVANHMGL